MGPASGTGGRVVPWQPTAGPPSAGQPVPRPACCGPGRWWHPLRGAPPDTRRRARGPSRAPAVAECRRAVPVHARILRPERREPPAGAAVGSGALRRRAVCPRGGPPVAAAVFGARPSVTDDSVPGRGRSPHTARQGWPPCRLQRVRPARAIRPRPRAARRFFVGKGSQHFGVLASSFVFSADRRCAGQLSVFAGSPPRTANQPRVAGSRQEAGRRSAELSRRGGRVASGPR